MVAIIIVSPLLSQSEPAKSSLSEIFLLDLGIVIEPAKGNETYTRLINAPSKEVDFRIKKVHSGSVYLAASKDLLAAIERINARISNIETTFNNEINILRAENRELKSILADNQSVKKKPPLPSITVSQTEPSMENDVNLVSLPEVESISIEDLPQKERFNQQVYMAGVFAYQRDDYQSALEYFAQCRLDLASSDITDNVLYWTADAYQQVHDYQKALDILNKLLENQGSKRLDDALVKQGLLYKKLGNLTLAMEAFDRVVNEYPNSEYTRLASLELKRVEMALQ